MTTARRKPLRMAVVGLGHFAQAAVIPAIRQLDDVELTALVSGTPEKLATLGPRHRVARCCGYDRYDELVQSGDVDAVYIVLPNDQHADFTTRAGRHGVHVLCEKPMAPSEDECVAMIEACSQGGAKLMIGYRLHFEAANLHAVELLRSGHIGEPRVFSSVFAMQVRPGNIRVQPRPGAGPLYDIGIYCINAARYLFQAEPVEVSATRIDNRHDERFAHVPESIAATLRFRGGQIATFTCSFGAADRAYYQVVGTEGRIELDRAYEYVEPMKMQIHRGDEHRTKTFAKRDQIAAEIEYFARCVRDDVNPEPSGHEGLADIRIIEALLRSAETGKSVEVALPERSQRPDPQQKITVPAHGKPRLVGVESASQ